MLRKQNGYVSSRYIPDVREAKADRAHRSPIHIAQQLGGVTSLLLNMNMEAGLYNSKELESFDYVIEAEPQIIDENYTGEAYYDEQKNVMIVEGKEYPPKTIGNPDHFRGISRAGAYVFEALDPWSGSFAFMAEDILKGDDLLEKPLPFAAQAGYILKAAAWMILSLILKEKTDFAKETL